MTAPQIAPGGILAGKYQVASLLADPAFKAGIVGRIPLGRVGETDDIAGPAIFLCSDAAAFITGQVIVADGGVTVV